MKKSIPANTARCGNRSAAYQITGASGLCSARALEYPQEETTLKYGAAVHKTQHFVVKLRIGGIAGVIAPLVGNQPPDIQFWILETEVPAFLQSEGQLSADTPVWRNQIASPDAESLKAAQ